MTKAFGIYCTAEVEKVKHLALDINVLLTLWFGRADCAVVEGLPNATIINLDKLTYGEIVPCNHMK